MPGRNGTGPMGAGAGTGRGMGGCAGASANGQHSANGNGCQRRNGRRGMQGRSFGRGFAATQPATTKKETLEQQRAALQAKLDQVEGQLKNL